MEPSLIRYKTKTATEYEIFVHLTECSDAFIPPLAERTNIGEYAKKIHEKSVTFEAWAGNLFIGFIAAYFNENAAGSAFITNVSVLRKFTGLGIASRLLDMCVEHGRKNKFHELTLEVHKHNDPAIQFYGKFGFDTCETVEDLLVMKRPI